MKKPRRSQSTSKKPSQSESNVKKIVLESIAAELHSLPGAKVERNKWLPSLINPGEEREIDVLITVSPVGYEMRIAIECRNLSRRIEAKDIGEFADKLRQVGIQTQGSIFVSASGYRRGAKTRAKELGMILLTPAGLTADRLAIAVEDALQSIVFLLPVVTEWTIHNNVHIDLYSQLSEHEQHAIYDENGNYFGFQFDLIWEKWHYDGVPPSIIGEHFIELDIPPGYHQIMQGKKEPILRATAKVLVWGLVASISGKVQRVSLLDAMTQNVQKFSLNAVFDTARNQVPVTTFTTQNDFQFFMNQHRALHVVSQRIRLPRMLTLLGYWPPSKRTGLKLASLMTAFWRGEILDPRPIDPMEIEGSNLSAIWDELVDDIPVVQRNIGREPFVDLP
jgi:hypothetical protein